MPQEIQELNPRVPTDVGPTAEYGRVNVEPKSSTLTDTLLGTDPPIEEGHPGLQPALVFGSYPIALVVMILIVTLYFFFFRSNPSDSNASPTHTESSN